jgi:hypothetical protein
MSARPTFRQLVAAYGKWQYELGVGVLEDCVEHADASRDDLLTALRRAGIPLDSPA